MKKLKIYGDKKGFKGFIATVYVDRDNKVEIDADDPKVKKELGYLIVVGIYGGLIGIPDVIQISKERKRRLFYRKKPGDPEFLEALRGSRLLACAEAGGYEIHGWLSKIVEE